LKFGLCVASEVRVSEGAVQGGGVVGWRGRGGGGSGVSDDAACYVLVPIETNVC